MIDLVGHTSVGEYCWFILQVGSHRLQQLLSAMPVGIELFRIIVRSRQYGRCLCISYCTSSVTLEVERNTQTSSGFPCTLDLKSYGWPWPSSVWRLKSKLLVLQYEPLLLNNRSNDVEYLKVWRLAIWFQLWCWCLSAPASIWYCHNRWYL